MNCETDKESLKMQILTLKHDIRTMNISIHNDYRGTMMGSNNSDQLLMKCRSDLDRIAQMWSG